MKLHKDSGSNQLQKSLTVRYSFFNDFCSSKTGEISSTVKKNHLQSAFSVVKRLRWKEKGILFLKTGPTIDGRISGRRSMLGVQNAGCQAIPYWSLNESTLIDLSWNLSRVTNSLIRISRICEWKGTLCPFTDTRQLSPTFNSTFRRRWFDSKEVQCRNHSKSRSIINRHSYRALSWKSNTRAEISKLKNRGNKLLL